MSGEAWSTESYGAQWGGTRGGNREAPYGPSPAPLPARQVAEWRPGDGHYQHCMSRNLRRKQ
eukprot:8888661-Alexandrium_andersonii.AAC.1